ncbi:hypothetical protein P154DRAFT_560031 [Amniculicola lignicola CBS 123094]|uniref:Zn(2)-C6 fungal-type domain-containing protein n=1 Tax=Amniculicola lignicola CBS 123094 TaxID=1392246 RepID=A0A6A5WTM3_9PLEO|nr:hypothetical protein P154DRAFT_560031 [Amniculicola lignicola CBS 123094]
MAPSTFQQPSWGFGPRTVVNNIGAGYSDSDDEDSNAQNGGPIVKPDDASTQLEVPPHSLVSLFGEPHIPESSQGGSFDPQGVPHGLPAAPQSPPSLAEFPSNFSDDGDPDNSHELIRAFPGLQMNNPQKRKKNSPCASGINDSDEDARAKKLQRSVFGSGPFDQSDSESDIDVDVGSSVEPVEGLEMDHDDGAGFQDTENHKGSTQRRFSFNLGFTDKGGSDRESSPASDKSSVSSGDLRPQVREEPAYELRKNIDRQVNSTWLDVDETGNYDPEAEAKKVRKPKAKKKTKKAAERKVKIKKLIVKLRFHKYGTGTIANIMDDEFNWPDGWSEQDSEDESDRMFSLPRRRENTPGVEAQEPIPDPMPSSEIDDLTGHPAARGCIACRRHGYECPMVKGGTWPCQQCKDSEVDCTLIIPPTEKGKCEHCQSLSDDVVCSFEDILGGGSAEAICDQCIEDGLTECHAPPREGYTHRTVDLDEIAYGPNRKWTKCTYCRLHRKICSLKRKTDRPPCKECKKAKHGCTFLDLTNAPERSTPPAKAKAKAKAKIKGKGKAKAVQLDDPTDNGEGPSEPKRQSLFTDADLAYLEEPEEETEVVREATPDIMMEDADGHRGHVIQVPTCFAHPIQFGIQIQSPHECSFCDQPQFGMFGHLEKKVHVIQWLDGTGMTEMGGGHTEHFNLTTMCEDCTMNRAQIICCPGHDLQQLEESEIIRSEEKPIDALMAADPGSAEMKRQLSRWCTCCFSLADFVCRTQQPSVTAEPGEEQMLISGCGLRLCKRCREELTEEHDEDFQYFIRVIDKIPKARATGIKYNLARADVGLLRANGLLAYSVGIA